MTVFLNQKRANVKKTQDKYGVKENHCNALFIVGWGSCHVWLVGWLVEEWDVVSLH
jgi:hypothetical protein